MSYLLDTHVLVWWFFQPGLLSGEVRDILEQPESEIFVSAITAYEIANKNRLGKWPEVEILSHGYQDFVVETGFKHLAMGADVALAAAKLESDHRDPFDRIIAAHSIRQSMIVLTKDPEVKNLGAITFW